MSVQELNLCGTELNSVSTIELDIVRSSIQRITWECVEIAAIEGTCTSMGGSLFDEITIDVRERTLHPHIDKLGADFRLPFGGTISWTKGKQSFLIGKFRNMPIYLNGDDHKDLNSQTLSIPWCMPSIKKGCADYRKMQSATALAHDDGETVLVGFWDVITSVDCSHNFKVEHQPNGDIPPHHEQLVLSFPFLKANPVYLGQAHVPMRRATSDHELAVAKQTGIADFLMGPKTTAKAHLEKLVKKAKAADAPPPLTIADKELLQLAKHILG